MAYPGLKKRHHIFCFFGPETHRELFPSKCLKVVYFDLRLRPSLTFWINKIPEMNLPLPPMHHIIYLAPQSKTCQSVCLLLPDLLPDMTLFILISD